MIMSEDSVVIIVDILSSLIVSGVMVASDVEVNASGNLDDVCLVTNGSIVMIVFGVHVLGPTQKVTSARWTQLESRKKVNCRSSCGVLVLGSKHTFMRELHEVTSWLMVVVDIGVASVSNAQTETLSTPIPHCGQLNITTSTLSTLMNLGLLRK